MRRVTPDDPFEDDGVSSRAPRVARLIDLLDDAETDGGERRGTVSRGDPLPNEPARVIVSAPTILSVTPEGEGETVAVSLVLPPCGEGKKSRRVKLRLLVEQYADLRAQGVSLECGDISEETAAMLAEAGELSDAIRRGMAALQYGDRSARRLAENLIAKGIKRETAEAAAAYLTRKGYIREEDTARRRVSGALRKGWGPRRIREDLRARWLEPKAVEAAMEELAQVDFDEICAEVIRKKYGDLPVERAERQKLTAALMRLGYDLDHIHAAMRLLSR